MSSNSSRCSAPWCRRYSSRRQTRSGCYFRRFRSALHSGCASRTSQIYRPCLHPRRWLWSHSCRRTLDHSGSFPRGHPGCSALRRHCVLDCRFVAHFFAPLRQAPVRWTRNPVRPRALMFESGSPLPTPKHPRSVADDLAWRVPSTLSLAMSSSVTRVSIASRIGAGVRPVHGC